MSHSYVWCVPKAMSNLACQAKTSSLLILKITIHLFQMLWWPTNTARRLNDSLDALGQGCPTSRSWSIGSPSGWPHLRFSSQRVCSTWQKRMWGKGWACCTSRALASRLSPWTISTGRSLSENAWQKGPREHRSYWRNHCDGNSPELWRILLNHPGKVEAVVKLCRTKG